MIMATHKGKHSIDTCLQSHRFSPFFSWHEAWQHSGGHSSGEVAERFSSRYAGSRKREKVDLVWSFENLKIHPSDILPPIQPHVF